MDLKENESAAFKKDSDVDEIMQIEKWEDSEPLLNIIGDLSGEWSK